MTTLYRRPPRVRAGLAALGQGSRAEVLRAVWWETRTVRAVIHRHALRDGCDLSLRSGSTVLGAGRGVPGTGADLVVAGDCPCRDYVIDVLAGADRFLAGRKLSNPAGAVRRHIRMRLSGDWIRDRRAAAGAQTRIDRIRRGGRARLLPDEFHRALLEYLVDEAGLPAPLNGEEHLLRRLAERAAAEFGGSTDEWLEKARSAMPAVSRAGRSGPRFHMSDGRSLTWWDRYVDEPLGRRPHPGVLSLDTPDDGARIFHVVAGADCGSTNAGPDETVVRALVLLPADHDLVEGVRRTVHDLVGLEAVPAGVAARFLSDPQRMDVVVEVLRSLAADIRASRPSVAVCRTVGT
ncbi:hypothetical protein [Pseudonocardia sp. ICBG1034]|uniref:hypothetical protein n=1 Tax=Pseudonocardia sp. ICBG1034 TaxID=2844381 RepID=UPI001CCCEDD5|nr:hypothetical protein [Pseudonocardia sp. ICBG1034]